MDVPDFVSFWISTVLPLFNFVLYFQFQSFQQFRAKIQKKTDEEIEILKHNIRTWDVLQVKTKKLSYSWDLKSGLVWIWNGQKEVGL